MSVFVDLLIFFVSGVALITLLRLAWAIYWRQWNGEKL